MSTSRRHARQSFSYLEKVVVFCRSDAAECHEGTIGEYGIVLGSSRRSRRGQAGGSQELRFRVRCLGTDRVLWLPEQQLVKTGSDLGTVGVPSDDHEISFDHPSAQQASRITGTFRLPREGWRTFDFKREALRDKIYEIRRPMTGSDAVTLSVHWYVSERARLDQAFVMRRLRILFGGKDWKEVHGPESRLFTPERDSRYLPSENEREMLRLRKLAMGDQPATEYAQRPYDPAEVRARLRAGIKRCFEPKISKAGLFRRLLLRWQMAREYRKLNDNLPPPLDS